MTTGYFATVQKISFNSYVVFGIGTTKNESIQDAMNWAEDGLKDFETIQCSKNVYEYVTDKGGQGEFTFDCGVLRLLWETES